MKSLPLPSKPFYLYATNKGSEVVYSRPFVEEIFIKTVSRALTIPTVYPVLCSTRG